MTGYPLVNSEKAEITDIVNAKMDCDNLKDFAQSVGYATGGLVNQKTFLICGGYSTTDVNAGETCHAFDSDDKDYRSFKMLQSRKAPASVVLDNGLLWVTGGTVLSTTLESTEFVDEATESSTAGPDLPIGLSQHCMVRINQSAVIVIGGSTDVTNRKAETWILDLDEDQSQMDWIQGPSLNKPRRRHACGLVFDPVTGSNMVVTVGGSEDSTVELLDLQSQDLDEGWIYGPSFPLILEGPSAVTFMDYPGTEGQSMIIVGGSITGETVDYLKNLYLFSCTKSGGCQWNKLKQKLDTNIQSPVAILIPDAMASCSAP